MRKTDKTISNGPLSHFILALALFLALFTSWVANEVFQLELTSHNLPV